MNNQFNVIKPRQEVIEEETPTVEVVATPDRYYSNPVMGEDNRKHVTVHFDGAEIDYCPIVFTDIRIIRNGNKIANATDDATKLMLTADILDILIGSNQADQALSDIAAFNGGVADFILYDELITFLSDVSNAVLGEDDLKK